METRKVNVMGKEMQIPKGMTFGELAIDTSSHTCTGAGMAKGHTPPKRSPVKRSSSSADIILAFW